MGIYITRRLLWLPTLLLMVSAVTFVLGTYGPGDPVRVMLGTRYDEATAERIRSSLGLDRPVIVQYADYYRGQLGETLGRALDIEVDQ